MSNIKVSIRIRPFLLKENDNEQYINQIDNKTIEIDKIQYHYDKIFDQNSTQYDVFEWSKFLFDDAINGVNCSLFMYGQTGTGKTYTILGEGLESGIFTDDRECDTEVYIYL